MFITVIHKKCDEFVIARFQSRGRVLQFVRGARHLLKDDETDVDALLAAWAAECQGDRVVLLLPPSALFLRELELPISDRKRCREVLPLELKGELASDTDEPVYEALPLAGGRVAAIWAKQGLLLEEIEFLEVRGFEPEAISFSMFNWQSLIPLPADGCLALTDGESVAVYQDGKPLFFRGLPRGDERALDATIAAVELGKGVTVDKIYQLPDLPPVSPLAEAFPGDSRAAADLSAEFGAARELALGDPVNLRRGGLGFTKNRDRLRRKLRLTYALAAALVILIFAEAGVRYFIVDKQLKSLNASITGLYKEVFPTRAKAVDEVSELKAEIRKLGATASDGALSVLKKLTDAKGDDPREIYEVDFDGQIVSGRGYDRSAQSVSDFKAKALLQFATFEVNEIKSRPDGSVSFAFRGTLKGGGK